MRTCAVLLVAGALLLLAGGAAEYGRWAVLDAHAFAERAASAEHQDEVQQEIADRIGDRLVVARPELATQRGAIDAGDTDLVRGWQFAISFRLGAAEMQRQLFHGDRPVVLVVPGGRKELVDAVARHSPAAARRIPSGDPTLFTLGGGRLETALVHAAPVARRLSVVAPFALLAGVVLLVAAVLRAPTLRRGLRRAAMAIAAVGGITIAGLGIARALVLSTFDTSHGDAVVGEIWSAYLGDLRLCGFVCGGVALVLAAAAEPGAPGSWRRALAWLTHPGGAAGRIARSLGLVLVALLLLTAPEVPVELALVGFAGLLIFTAAAEVARLRPRAHPADY